MACKIGKLVCKETALFLCDMQEKFRNTIQYFPEIVQVSSRLLKAAKILDIPVVVTEQYPKGLGSTVPEIGLSEFPDIQPIAKTQFSMLTEDVIKKMETDWPSIKSVVLCGIETHVCVQGTCLSLLEKGFDVHVVVDACSSRTMVDRMFSFDRMKAAGAWLTTSESVILGLLGGSSHPKFKECQKLILSPAPDSGLLSILVGIK
ncbi:mitochondrial associated endoribonuclease MAR1-isochorismatase superfamily-like protein [Dinothrombium tinctorium]|uniref:Mitochondrial associated endoribonuclease MAR1-isochorismatase superfamily-like protein n=1 Tax=Dinothrombium tinctorium TaxID=1965070 RepID=A0A3S3PJM3_9ACAR|nr:mitochondrial associated endoribonuclease MAR1-isochorismatase superfamily-like protein [Dinothrombium tinctorium]RWS08480.1 mitochondrial associated endoribonuclease MAR1-isochorismatase superfamily-like protein [Dinothrombium tinctorium]RWS13824.1 mitochondrial associated endoribonuclease MAR1-isochorismatase superfamily-like protein [Dinothrombium tinctorium]